MIGLFSAHVLCIVTVCAVWCLHNFFFIKRRVNMHEVLNIIHNSIFYCYLKQYFRKQLTLITLKSTITRIYLKYIRLRVCYGEGWEHYQVKSQWQFDRYSKL